MNSNVIPARGSLKMQEILGRTDSIFSFDKTQTVYKTKQLTIIVLFLVNFCHYNDFKEPLSINVHSEIQIHRGEL